jgi:proton-dependent oligopeptide transporter, POT family
MSMPEATVPARPLPFPRVFWVANWIELLERLAFYGVYINLQVYLLTTVGMTEKETGGALGIFALGKAWLPVVIGALADRIGFRISLICAFVMYAIAYGTLFAAPLRLVAYLALVGIAIGGAFMKPVITGCVSRYSPPGRQRNGFAIFYAIVNAGSVIGKVLAKNVRTMISLRATMITSIIASLIALLTAIFFFREPEGRPVPTGGAMDAIRDTLRGFAEAFKNWRLSLFLVVVSGYYLLIEQFYQTFPGYMLRVLGPDAPREYITLINPLSIAVLQVFVASFAKKLEPVAAMATGIMIGAVSMVTMGLYPTLFGAAASFFVFALAEMVFSPSFYDYVASFAPKGREGLYMGLALVPAGLGGLAGGFLSGDLMARHLPVEGPKNPLAIWGTYAVIGVGCAAILVVYRFLARRGVRALAQRSIRAGRARRYFFLDRTCSSPGCETYSGTPTRLPALASLSGSAPALAFSVVSVGARRNALSRPPEKEVPRP